MDNFLVQGNTFSGNINAQIAIIQHRWRASTCP